MGDEPTEIPREGRSGPREDWDRGPGLALSGIEETLGISKLDELPEVKCRG